MKRVAVLLNGSLVNDGRVIKTIQALSQTCLVDVYFQSHPDEPAGFNDRVGLYPFQPRKGLRTKLLRHTLFYREFDFLYKMVLQSGKKYDFILANDLPTLYPGVRLKQKLNARLIYDSHEIYIETLNQFFPTEGNKLKLLCFKIMLSFMKRSGASMEKRMLRHVDHFLTVNKSLANYFEKIYDVQGVKVMMNCPILKAGGYEPVINYRDKYKWNQDDTILLYQGVLNNGRGLPLMIDAIKQLPQKFKLVILGDGMLKPLLEKQVEELGLQNRVMFFGRVPYDQLLHYTVGADIGLNLLESFNLSKQFASPNKLFEYIHAGIPVLCSDTVENRNVIESYNIGILTPNEAGTIAEKINYMADSKNRVQFTQNCEQAAAYYNWEIQSQVLHDIMGT